MTGRLRPTFAIIGAARASTTAVAWALGARPDVFVTEPKETHFWAFAGTSPHFTGPGDDEMINRWLVTDPEAYLALYDRARGSAGDVAVRGDGSVSTLSHPDRSIENLRRHADPDVRLVCLVREPVARARSAHLYLRSRGYEPFESFAAALAAEPERIEAGWHHMWHYRSLSRYADQLPAFVDAFGDRLLVAVAEEVQADPDTFTRSLCAHLDIDPGLGLDLSGAVNVGGEPRSAVMSSAMTAIRRRPAVQRVVRAAVPRSVRETVRRWSVRRPAVDVSEKTDHGIMATLRRDTEADVAAVEDVLGRRVTAWNR